ncbi:hypothetical protein OHA70_01270 [Kribbella sp. NBC_00382]|uniref:hypothetical protein n=1 Tax=Kribbella sp. NBC_00382 TaxID=2975967 RepID=UPI002E20DA4F
MNTPQSEPRLFHLVRPPGASPVAGAAGLVIVAEGVEWSDGTVTLRWRGRWPATSAWEGGIAAVLAVHGQNGTTKLRWLSTPSPSTTAAPPLGTTSTPAPESSLAAVGGLRLAAPGVDGRCVSCGLVWPCLSCGP